MHNTVFSADSVKLLLVDDNELNLELLKDSFKSAGFTQFIMLTDPLKVAEAIKEHQFDLILLDINMPILDGFGVLSYLQQTLADKCPPVLMVTAQNDMENRLRALDEGASDYITKPFNRNELLQRTNIHLENWVLRKQLEDERRLLEQRVKERTTQLEQAQLEVVKRLGRASEYRDNETGNHVNRVSLISEILADQIGCEKSFSQLIRLASPMHDIGKIGISDLILLKPGKLTDEEYTTMKNHVEIGADILMGSSVELIQLAHEIALTHHEKFDGSGYPKGLQGENIPLSGRIVAIADVYDALSSARPYKEPWSFEKTIDFLISQKNKHFDPKLIDAFVARQEEIREISKQYSDNNLYHTT